MLQQNFFFVFFSIQVNRRTRISHFSGVSTILKLDSKMDQPAGKVPDIPDELEEEDEEEDTNKILYEG